MTRTTRQPSADEARRAYADAVAAADEAFHAALEAGELKDLRTSFWSALHRLTDSTAYWRIEEVKCCVCGCTEDNACAGGCWWIDGDDMQDRCSACEGLPIPDRDQAARDAFTAAYKYLGAPGDFSYGMPEGQSLKRLYDAYNAFLKATAAPVSG